MSQIQIMLPEDTTKKLKILAAKADRSLKKFIPLYLNQAIDLNIIDIDERTGAFITPNTNSNLIASSQSLTLEQLKEAGIKDFKFNSTIMDNDKQLLAQQKLDLEKQKIKKKRLDVLKQKCQEILGGLLPYLEDDDQKTIDFVLNTYTTDEEIVKYLENLTQESVDYLREIKLLEENLAHPLAEEYEQIKYYCIAHNTTYELYQLLLYPSTIQIENYDYIIKPALGTPSDYMYSQEELELFLSYFTPVQ